MMIGYRLTGLRRLGGAVAFLLASGPAFSEAQTAGASPSSQGKPTTESPKERAARLQREGVALLHQQEYDGYEKARGILTESYGLDPQSETLLDLGMAEFMTDRPVEAAAHLKEYLARKQAPPDKLKRVEEQWLQPAEAQTARLDIYVPSGAEVTIDGRPQDRTPSVTSAAAPPGSGPLTIVIRQGEHDVAERSGVREEVKHVVAHGGEHIEIHFQPMPETPPAAPASTPLPSEVPSAAESRMAHRATGKWLTVGILGSGAVLAGIVGVGFTVAFNANAGIADRLSHALGPSGCAQAADNPGCSQLRQAHDAEHTDASLGTAFFLGAAIAAVGAAASWALWPSTGGSPATGRPRVMPAIGNREAGLALAGVW